MKFSLAKFYPAKIIFMCTCTVLSSYTCMTHRVVRKEYCISFKSYAMCAIYDIIHATLSMYNSVQ